MSKQPSPAPTASAVGPCPTISQIRRTPWHWKFTQHHHTTQPPPCSTERNGRLSIKQEKPLIGMSYSLKSSLSWPSLARVSDPGPSWPSCLVHTSLMQGGGAMVLGKLSVPWRPTNLDQSRARAYCACSRCGLGVVWTFFLSSILSLHFLPLSGRRSDID